MAGLSLGASAPGISNNGDTPSTAARRTLQLIPATTRTRRNHGVFTLGTTLATVYSSRREFDGKGVMLVIGDGDLVLNGTMSPAHARGMARALLAAASAVDAQRRPVFNPADPANGTEGEARHV